MTLETRPKKKNFSLTLARMRSLQAADRTLLAWVRTSLSLIGFGFGVGKLIEYLALAAPKQDVDPTRSARVFGVVFIALGLLALLGALIQHRRIQKRIKQREILFTPYRPLTELVALLLLLAGMFAFIVLLL